MATSQGLLSASYCVKLGDISGIQLLLSLHRWWFTLLLVWFPVQSVITWANRNYQAGYKLKRTNMWGEVVRDWQIFSPNGFNASIHKVLSDIQLFHFLLKTVVWCRSVKVCFPLVHSCQTNHSCELCFMRQNVQYGSRITSNLCCWAPAFDTGQHWEMFFLKSFVLCCRKYWHNGKS